MLNAATSLLIESGPRSVTVDAVAQRSGVAKSTLYRHWASRQDLIVDVFRSNEPDVPVPAPELGFVEALESFVSSIVVAFSNPEWRKILPSLLSMRSHMPEVAEIFDDDHSAHIEMFAAILDRGVGEGLLPEDVDPVLTLQAFVGPVMMAAMTEKVPVADIAQHVLERFLASYA